MAAVGSPSSSSRLIGGRSRRSGEQPLLRLLALKGSALRPSSSLSSEFLGVVRLVSGSAAPTSMGRRRNLSVVAMAGDGETHVPLSEDCFLLFVLTFEW